MSDSAVLAHAPETLDDQAAPATRVRGYWQSVGYRLRHDKVTLFFAAMVLLIIGSAVFAPLLAPFDPYKESVIGRLKPMGWRNHLLGTDDLGRDMLTRLLFGGRVSLLMGIVPVIFATCVGGMLGVIAGFVGGRVNTGIMRTMDVFYAFPSVLLAIAISGAMGGGTPRKMRKGVVMNPPPMPNMPDRKPTTSPSRTSTCRPMASSAIGR